MCEGLIDLSFANCPHAIAAGVFGSISVIINTADDPTVFPKFDTLSDVQKYIKRTNPIGPSLCNLHSSTMHPP